MNRTVPVLVVIFTVCALNAQERPRVTQRVDDSRILRRSGTTHPLTRRALDLGRAAAADVPMERMLLQLNSSPEQDAELEQLIDAQHDPQSPRYRQWLTPEEFGARFGPVQSDVEAVTTWLEGQGFRVHGIARGRRVIEFSGTVAQVESAFHTEIRYYDLNGERHMANSGDIAVPVALGPVVRGVASLHDFRAKPLHRVQAAGAVPVPLTNLNGGTHGLSPYDFATIYNLTPLWNSNFDGAGQSIAIVGRSNIRPTDAATFRSSFGLPANPPQVILNGPDPGVLSAGEETEADLDVQWSGGVAKGATVKFVVSKSTGSTDGVFLSSQYIVNNNVAPVMSVSFGLCEASLGSGNNLYSSLWQQAAAQGISVFVSSGDSGSADCDSPGSTQPATHGFGVNGLASSPYNVAVGGTQFNDTGNPAAYWNASNDSHLASAKSYIPETSWNESSYVFFGSSNNLYAGGGGVSLLWATPSWQTGAGVPAGDPGAPAQHHRYLPDISLAAAGHDGYLVYQNGGLYMVGGTSASSPAFAGLMAIVNQYTGVRNGNPNPRFYSLAAQVPAAFHDVTTGTIAVPCQGGTSGCATQFPWQVGQMSGFSAGPGYDLASGLGSVDAFAMVSNWGSNPGPVPPAITSLSPNPMTGSNSSQSLTINGTGFVAGATVTASAAGVSTLNLTVGTLSATQITTTINVGTTARTWTIRVTNPSTLFGTASLTVNAPPVGPTITSLVPNPMTGSNSSQSLTINGTGFVSGATVTASAAGVSTLNLTVGTLSATQITTSINVGTTARTWTITVTNPNTQFATANLTVNAPPVGPTITSLVPNPMTGSNSSQSLTINGTGFVSGATVTASAAGVSTLNLTVGTLSATQITTSINVGTTARTWTITVTNPNTQFATASLTVNAPPVGPTITSLSPNPMTGSNSNQSLTINGTGFVAGATVTASAAGVSTLNLTVGTLSAAQITTSINVGTTARTWTITVTNPNTQFATASLTVNAPASPPAITSLSPNPMTGSNSSQSLTINGTGFVAGATVTASAAGVSTLNLTVGTLSATQITTSINVGTTARTWTITVTNPNTQFATASLTVNAPVAGPTITSIDPNPNTGGFRLLTINGSGFVDGPALKVIMSYPGFTQTLSGSQIAFLNGGQVMVLMDLGSTPRTWTVQVVNPNGGASNLANLTVQP